MRLKRIAFLGILIIAVFLSLSYFLQPVFAEAKCEGVSTSIIECGENESGIYHIVKLVIEIMTVGIGVLGVIGISVVGVQYLTARDDEGQVRKAKRRLFEILIGLAVYAVAFMLAEWLLPGGFLNGDTDKSKTQGDSSKVVPKAEVK